MGDGRNSKGLSSCVGGKLRAAWGGPAVKCPQMSSQTAAGASCGQPRPLEGAHAAVPPPTLCSIYLFTGAQLPKALWKIPALICTNRLVCSRLGSKSTSTSPRLTFFFFPSFYINEHFCLINGILKADTSSSQQQVLHQDSHQHLQGSFAAQEEHLCVHSPARIPTHVSQGKSQLCALVHFSRRGATAK